MALNKGLKLHRDIAFKHPVIVSGMRSSGKSVVLGLMHAFVEVPSIIKDFRLSHICQLDYWQLLDRDISIPLLRYSVDFGFYDLRIGRGLNFRIGDETSVWSSLNVGEYVKLISAPKGDSVFEEADGLQIFDIHNALLYSSLLSQSFETVKIINITRSPISVMHSWVRDGLMDDDRLLRPSSQMLITILNDRPIPLIAASWKHDYLKMNLEDRSVCIYRSLLSLEKEARKLVGKNLQILDLTFEGVVQDPSSCMKMIELFLGKKHNDLIDQVYDKERVPRVLDWVSENQKLIDLKKNLSDENKGYLENFLRF